LKKNLEKFQEIKTLAKPLSCPKGYTSQEDNSSLSSQEQGVAELDK